MRFLRLAQACAFAALFAIAAAQSPGSNAGRSLPSAVQDGPDVDRTRILFSYTSAAPPVAVSKTVGAALGLRIGVYVVKPGETPDAAMANIRAQPGVTFAEFSTTYRALATPNDPSFAASQWNMKKIGADVAWDKSTGANGPTVCVIDSGIDYTHPDIAGNMHPTYGKGWNAIRNRADCKDDHGHGTHCAGVIGAVSNNGVGLSGINWKAKIVGCKFLDSRLGGVVEDAIECISYCTATAGAKILSNSWSGTAYSQLLADAVNTAINTRGALFVAAAGNANTDISAKAYYPAMLPGVLAVGATDQNDARCSFSNFGNNAVDIYAPGCGGSGVYSLGLRGAYAYMSGTSMAAPHVAGAAALVDSVSGGSRSASDLANVLISTGSVVTTDKGSVRRLNLQAAIA